MSYTPAQKKAYAKRMAAKKTYAKKPTSYTKKVVYKGNGAYKKTANYKQWYTPPDSLGATLGGWLGHGAHQIIKAVTGFGDYNIQYNSLMGGVEPPELVNNKRSGGILVRHREYIQDIIGSTNFTIDKLAINPGLVNSFPWLSTIAGSFEEYKLRGLIFEFKSMSSDAVLSSGTNSALGTVIMATQYNSLSPIFPDKKTMENYEFANSSKPSCSFLHPVECKQSINPVQELYVRTGNPTSGDIRLYDLGDFYIATQGQQADGGVIGELWATFEIEFYKPKLLNAIGYNLLTDHWQLKTVSNTNPLGTTSSLATGSELGSAVISGKYLSFPNQLSDGNFLINYIVTGGSSSPVFPTLTYGNCIPLQIWLNDGALNALVANTNIMCILLIVQINDIEAQIEFGSDGTLPTSVTAGDLWITQINGEITK